MLATTPLLTLCQVEDVVPQPCLQVALHLGQVEVGPVAPRHTLTRVVEEEQAKVKQGGTAAHTQHDMDAHTA